MRHLFDRRSASDDQAPRRRFSYANVVSTLALFLVLAAGTAYAGDHYLITSTSQIKPGVIAKLRGHNGATGPAGPKGATGGVGVAGPSGITDYNIAISGNESNPADTASEGTESCPSGDSVLGGGVLDPYGGTQLVQSSYPASSSEWEVLVNNSSSSTRSFNVYAVCARVSS